MTTDAAQYMQLQSRINELEAELDERRHSEQIHRALYEIASLSAADTPEHEHYVRLHEIVGRLMDARNFIIASYDQATGMIHQEYLVDEDPDEVPDSFPYGEGISSLVIRRRKPLLLDDATFRALVAAQQTMRWPHRRRPSACWATSARTSPGAWIRWPSARRWSGTLPR